MMVRFTIRIKPFKGESLSSFMLRFSKENGVKFLTFWNMMKKPNSNYAQMSHLYLLNYTPLNILDYSKLVVATGLNEIDIFNLTLYNILKKFSINDNLDRSRFLINMVRDEMFYYCPLCLKESPYHRLIWTFEDITLCLKHRVNLKNTCPKCGKSIRQNDIREIGKCPYCFESLFSNIEGTVQNEEGYKIQTWLHNSLLELMQPIELKFESKLLARKILYILNDKEDDFNRELVCRNIPNPKLVPTLLQHARETLSQERTIYLKFIISLLVDKHISFKEFYEMNLPEEFIETLLKKPKKYMEEPYCKAPWCKNYKVQDSLVKIATSYHKKSDGNFQSYYFICPECGCEFIYDKEGFITERTKYIQAYNQLNNFDLETMQLSELATFSNVSKDKMIRHIAYFSSNKILDPIARYSNIKISDTLINMFIEQIQNGTNIEDIRSKDYWKNNYHYLIHRYNNKVLQAIAIEHLRRHINPNLEEKHNIVNSVIKELYENGIKITIDAVCQRLGIAHETIRAWKCNEIIQNMKNLQKSES